MLRRTARKTWRYFDTFVTETDAWLVPDNYQDDDTPKLARRTSPTNIAMSLLSTLAAHDLGYVSTDALIRRLDATLGSLEGLERYRGHFLNWYDTASLAPLHPRYVSTVDSGNLAGSLIALAQGLLADRRAPADARATARRTRRHGRRAGDSILVERCPIRTAGDRHRDQSSRSRNRLGHALTCG